jgi:hypothetical protein
MAASIAMDKCSEVMCWWVEAECEWSWFDAAAKPTSAAHNRRIEGILHFLKTLWMGRRLVKGSR